MLYLGIDQHKAQLTVNLRNEHGEVIDKRQVSTKHSDIDAYFGNLAKQAAKHRGYYVILEVCCFNPWLLEKLKQYHCRKTIVVQPNSTAVNKTDQRDADNLCTLLWNNRKRVQEGKPLNGISQAVVPSPAEQEIRQAANLRQYLVQQRTRNLNKIKAVLNKHNMVQDAPTECCRTKLFYEWVASVSLRWNQKYQFHYEPLKRAPSQGEPAVTKPKNTQQGGQRPPGKVFQGIRKDNQLKKRVTSPPRRSKTKT